MYVKNNPANFIRRNASSIDSLNKDSIIDSQIDIPFNQNQQFVLKRNKKTSKNAHSSATGSYLSDTASENDKHGLLKTSGEPDLEVLSDDAFVDLVNNEWGAEETELRQAIYF